MTPTSPLASGTPVVCLDATDGAHFLFVGYTYTVSRCYPDPTAAGRWRVTLVGMARAWEAERFRVVTAATMT